MGTGIGLVNESTVVSLDDTRRVVGACARQLQQHVAPAWGLTSPTLRLFSSEAAVPADWFPVVILDSSDQADALGYHAVTPSGRPYGKSFAGPVLDHGGQVLTGSLSVSAVTSHELCELLVDLDANLWADDGGTLEVAYEVCDPVESSSYTVGWYGYDVAVSNFVLRAWFDAAQRTGPFDYLGHLKAPRTLEPGGYLIYRTGAREGQRFAAEVKVEGDYPAWRTATKLYPAARTARRLS